MCFFQNSSVPEPAYTITREPAEGDVPEFLVLEVQLPKIVSHFLHLSLNLNFSLSDSCFVDTVQMSAKALTLDVGEDRLLLTAHPRLYSLDLDLPYTVDSDETGAQFNKDSKVTALLVASAHSLNSCRKIKAIFELHAAVMYNALEHSRFSFWYDESAPNISILSLVVSTPR